MHLTDLLPAPSVIQLGTDKTRGTHLLQSVQLLGRWSITRVTPDLFSKTSCFLDKASFSNLTIRRDSPFIRPVCLGTPSISLDSPPTTSYFCADGVGVADSPGEDKVG